ncbi:TetR/AcrR family transcriptional regulator [Streptococcus intermedius]|uniref:TetR/AcrR family transcriptional regulator n=1 Tax=Streptococcus intermedius TaxID=1338 RepID=UPI001F60F009|nr:TetR/AcrR family transcriptional regulator [Streptococcus intermedius]MCI3918404.1 TetR/AcrR family transcriptional regulator [Streptococcus intermedius]
MERKRLSKEKRRKQIKEIALKLFVDKGYSKITMEEIVQAVGISKGGMYHHFSNKEEIFLELLRDGDEYRKDIVQKSMRENLLSRRDKIVDILLERILDKNPYKDLYTVFLIEMQGNDKFKMLFEKIYDESHDNFVEFIKKEGLEEYNAISNREFTFLMNCLYMGIYLFDNVDRVKLKEMLKLMFEAYLT